jgi:hypothetical protein
MTAFAAPHHLGRDWTTTDKGLREGRIGPQRLTQLRHCERTAVCCRRRRLRIYLGNVGSGRNEIALGGRCRIQQIH